MTFYFLDDWHDYLRVGVLLLSLWCCLTLIRRFRLNNTKWTTKTKDYWYALLMWTFVGITFSIQGIAFDRDLSPALIVVTAAVMVTGKGLNKKGSWGGED